MPELPEVERARRLLHGRCVGHTISDVQTVDDNIVFVNCAAGNDLILQLKGRNVVNTGRRGKILWLELSGEGPHLVLHFGMTGSVQVKGEDGLKFQDFDTACEYWPPKYSKFVITMSNDVEIAFTDPRRLGRVRLIADPLNEPPISDLGFDPTQNMPATSDFIEMVRARNMPIKSLLLDQAFSAGIGNWVADEVLYHARVHPQMNTRILSDLELEGVHSSILFVINTACDANADSDRFPNDWIFHHRWSKGKKSTEMSSGEKISFVTVGGRTSAFVSSKQKFRHSNPNDDAADQDVGSRKRKGRSEEGISAGNSKTRKS